MVTVAHKGEVKTGMFGTDGIRGEFGQGIITPQEFLKLGFSLGQIFSQTVCIGYDGRASGEILQHALVSGLMASGVNVELLGVVPTPLVSNWVKHSRLNLGIMITASHNSAKDNGIKLVNSDGEKIKKEQKKLLEEQYLNGKSKPARLMGKCTDVSEVAIKKYTENISRALNSHKLRGQRILIDPAFGACSKMIRTLFETFGMKVDMICDQLDGYNINQNSGTTNPKQLQKEVLRRGYELGVAFDGDGDRCILVDGKGRILDGDNMLYIMANSVKEIGQVVTTKMANLGLLEGLRKLGVDVICTDVGDQNVYEAMKKNNITIGSEPNGHMIMTPWCQGGDGPLSALMCINEVIKSGISFEKWNDKLLKYPQKIVNIYYENPKQCQILEKKLNDNLLRFENVQYNIRKSGTEPLLRVLIRAGQGQEALLDKLEDHMLKVSCI